MPSRSTEIAADRGATAELAQRVRDGFVPLMREMTGFRGYYLLDGGPEVLIAISMFDRSRRGGGVERKGR